MKRFKIIRKSTGNFLQVNYPLSLWAFSLKRWTKKYSRLMSRIKEDLSSNLKYKYNYKFRKFLLLKSESPLRKIISCVTLRMRYQISTVCVCHRGKKKGFSSPSSCVCELLWNQTSLSEFPEPPANQTLNAIHRRWMLNTNTRVYFSAPETLKLHLHSCNERCRTLPVIYEAAAR